MLAHDFVGHGVDPFQKLSEAALFNQGFCVLQNKPGSRRKVVRRQGVLNRFGNKLLALKPVTGLLMQSALLLGWQLSPQEIAKEGVITVPLPYIIERDEKKIGLLKPVEHRLAVVLPGNSVGQRP